MKKQGKLLFMAILIMVSSCFIELLPNSFIYCETETFKPLLPKENVNVYNYTFLYNDGSITAGGYSLTPVNKFDRNSVVLDKNLNVIHKVPNNVSFQYFSNKKIVNAWLTSDYYGSPVIYEIDGKLITMPYTGNVYIDYGLSVVEANGKNKVYNLENGNLIVSFDKSYGYDRVIPISNEYLLVSYKNKYNIYDYSDNKLFPELDDIGLVSKMRNGILITKDALINTNLKMMYKFQDITGTNASIGAQITENCVHYITFSTDKINDLSWKSRYNMWLLSFDGKVIEKRFIGTDSYLNQYLGSIDNYLLLEQVPINPNKENRKIACFNISENKKLWEWTPENYDLDQYSFFDDAGFKMITRQKNGFLMMELSTGKILKEYLAPSVLDTMNDCKNQYLDVPVSASSKVKSLYRINANMKLQSLGCVAPTDSMNVSGNNAIKVHINRQSEHDYEITWNRFDLRNSMLTASSKREFVNIFEPQKYHLCGTDRMVIISRDHTLSVMEFANGLISKVDYPGIDPKKASINNKVECKVFGNNAYLFFSFPVQDNKKTLITLDLKSAKVVRTDKIHMACSSIFYASEGMLVSDLSVKWFDRKMEKGVTSNKMLISGCQLYSCSYEKKLLITDLATGRQRESKKSFFRSISSVDEDIVYTHSGIFTIDGDWLQDYVPLEILSKDQSSGTLVGNANSGVVKYSQCPVFSMNTNKSGEIEIKSNNPDFVYQVYMCKETENTDIVQLDKIELTSNGSVPSSLIEKKSKVKLFVFSNGLLDSRKSNPVIDKNSLRPRFEGYPVNFGTYSTVVVTKWGGK